MCLIGELCSKFEKKNCYCGHSYMFNLSFTVCNSFMDVTKLFLSQHWPSQQLHEHVITVFTVMGIKFLPCYESFKKYKQIHRKLFALNCRCSYERICYYQDVLRVWYFTSQGFSIHDYPSINIHDWLLS